MDGIFCSLDEARAAIHRRWQDEDLKRRVRDFLGGRFLPGFGETPRS